MKPNMEICPICGKEFQNGPHSYGKYLRGYQITVCRDCDPPPEKYAIEKLVFLA